MVGGNGSHVGSIDVSFSGICLMCASRIQVTLSKTYVTFKLQLLQGMKEVR